MFPWLQGGDNQNENQNKRGLNRYEDRGRNGNRQNQSEQDLIKSFKIQNNNINRNNDDQDNDKEQQFYNHSKSENKLNQDNKYNPYYDNKFSHNFRLGSRSNNNNNNNINFGQRNSATSKSPRNEGIGINFEVDYKHKLIDQNKQSYKDYYRDNVSVFQKNKNQGSNANTNEDKKSILQSQYTQSNNIGITARMSQNQRQSVSPQQQKQEYANILKKQIEEKKELMRQKQKKEEELEYQNNYNARSYKNQEQRRDNYEFDNVKPKKVVEFNVASNAVNNDDNYRSEVDYESLAKNNNNNNSGFISPPFKQPNTREASSPQYNKNQDQQRNQRISFEDADNVKVKKERIKWNDEDNLGQNLLGRMYEQDERTAQIKKQREIEHYKSLENEINAQRGRRDSAGTRDKYPYTSSKDKSMLEQLGDNYSRQQELYQQHRAEIAQDLQEQIKEKKRKQRLEKEKEDLLDRQYEERVKAEIAQLNLKNQTEMQGKQLEIKSLRKNLEKKKQEQIQQQGELVLSKSSKSPPKNLVENSPRIQAYNDRRGEDNEGYVNTKRRGGSNEEIDEVGNIMSNNVSQNGDIHQQARDIRQQKRHEDREKFRDSLFEQQHEYYANREINKEWNPPSFWQYKEKKNMQELSQLKEQLDMQTSLLQNDVQKIKQDASVASEMKSQAFIDLENLKDSLKRQNMIENVKLRELKQNLGNLSYVQNDFLPSSASNNNYGGQNIANQSIFQTSTKNIQPNLLNQSSFSQNLNYSQFGTNQNGIYNNNNNYNSNNYNSNSILNNKYGLQSTDILDKLVSQNMNVYRFEGTRLNNKPTTNLDFKLEKRLNNVQLNKAEIQLLEVDNLLNNLRNGL